MEKEFIITNEQGIHARPASELVKLANTFKSEISLTYDGITVDLKSIMGVLSLGVKRGTTVVIRIEGEDEVEALNSISKRLMEHNLR